MNDRGFTLDIHMVRGDLFTEHGKWKYTVAIDMCGSYDAIDLHSAVVRAFRSTPSDVRGVIDGVTGYRLVVLEPYHRNGYPVCVMI